MVYRCDICNYKTTDRSNFWRHNHSKKHSKNVKEAEKIRQKTPSGCFGGLRSDRGGPLTCNSCGKRFAQAYNLKRHISLNRCIAAPRVKELEERIRELEEERRLNSLLAENRELRARLECNEQHSKEKTAFIMSGKAGNTTYNISTKRYIEQRYPDAPDLQALPNYKKPLLDYQKQTNTADHDLVEVLVYYEEQKILHEYLGEFIIPHYKKEYPQDQSVWLSDKGRLTYFVKELVAKNESCWQCDPKGKKLQEKIIDPLMAYLKAEIKHYRTYYGEILKKTKASKQQLIIEKLKAASKLERRVEGKLANKMVSYIGPYFYMEPTANDIKALEQKPDNTRRIPTLKNKMQRAPTREELEELTRLYNLEEGYSDSSDTISSSGDEDSSDDYQIDLDELLN